MSDEWVRERAEKQLSQMIDWIGRHDSRSAGLMGITVAMMGALSAATPPLKDWSPVFMVALGITVTGFGFVLYQLMRGQIPRLRAGKPSLSFFGTVAGMPPQDFRDKFVAMTEAEYIEDLLSQCYVNARILRSKFRCLKRGLVGLLVTAIPWAWAISLAKSL
ncbi:hypothetical protein GCM10007276_18500 [Agaricicola taiwanensis]|uniref:Pycsar effector protein domain-containing protein n=1 Tax=Agaricicola taiwanensis TaxID=591372 RepID=A0A8J2YFB5_9RHOB|nr:Pycsar system effector family protein [Agaricicola taiwanensis]GGE41406.1 hypothetical protein GCM10007276_18500 [Agaricicola taiwanensis]